MKWAEYNIWSNWIVNGRYITVLSYRKSVMEVIEAVKEKADELGGYVKDMPLVLLSSQFVSNRESDYLSGMEEGQITLVME